MASVHFRLHGWMRFRQFIERSLVARQGRNDWVGRGCTRRVRFHYLLRSTLAMKRTPLKRKTQLAPVSQARQRENTQRAKNLETEFGPRRNWRCILRDNPVALAALGPCYGGVNGHEIVKASQGGSRTDVENIVLLCNFHNGEVENQPVIARSLGLVRSSWER